MQIQMWNGEKIQVGGIYAGIPLEQYHTDICVDPSVSSTDLRRAWRYSLADMHAFWPCNPNRLESKSTSAMQFGAAAHHLLLGEDEFSKIYVCKPRELPNYKTGELRPWHGNNVECKRWLSEQGQASRVVVSEDDLDKVKAIADSLRRHPAVEAGILLGDVEMTMTAQDTETGLWIRVRPDVVPSDADYADLKTIAEGTEVAALAAIANEQYHMQGALVWQVCELLGLPFESFSFLFVGKEAPHNVIRATLDDEALSLGRRQNEAMLHQIANALAKNDWPGPPDIERANISQVRREFIEKKLALLQEQMQREAA